LADAAEHATAEVEEAKEKQRVLDDGKYKKLIRGKKILIGQVYSEGWCSTCVNCQCTCWINVEAIKA